MGIRGRARTWVVGGARRLRRTVIGQVGFGWLLEHAYPLGSPTGRRADMVSRIITWDPASAVDRAATKRLLGDLFFDLVDVLGVERFVEAGAKDASASVRASALPAIASVTAFEANPYTHRRFARRLGRTRVRYEPLALSDEPGDVTFHVLRGANGRTTAHGQSSLLTRHGHAAGSTAVTVRAVTLDGYLAGEASRPTALWIDVEGAAGAALRGAANVLVDTVVLIIEVEERRLWDDDQWLRHDVVEHLHRHGLVPVARDLQSRFQHNVVFIRRELSDWADVRSRLARWSADVRLPQGRSPRSARRRGGRRSSHRARRRSPGRTR